MSLSYFPMYPDDFEADTAHLTLAEDGAYNRLLRLCWRTPGCSVPSDRAWIYRRMRAVSDDDKAIVDIVLDEFFSTEKGRVSNARLTKEWLAANEAHQKRKSAGAKGGRAKPLKKNKSPPSNAKAMPKQPEPEPEPVKEKENSTSFPKRNGELVLSDDDLEIPKLLDRRTPRGTRLPDDWEPAQLPMSFAQTLKLQPSTIETIIPVELANFKDYWRGKTGQNATKLDWDATWCVWLRKACQDKLQGRRPVERADPLAEALRQRR